MNRIFPASKLLGNLLFNKLSKHSSLIPNIALRGYSLLSPIAINIHHNIIKPHTNFLQQSHPLLIPFAGFKVKGRLRRRCKDCFFVMRQERLYVLCKTHPRHKQMSMKKKPHNTWILTHATQSKIRPY